VALSGGMFIILRGRQTHVIEYAINLSLYIK
jgi:hypothetical protein